MVELLRRGESVPILPRANTEGVSEEVFERNLRRYQGNDQNTLDVGDTPGAEGRQGLPPLDVRDSKNGFYR